MAPGTQDFEGLFGFRPLNRDPGESGDSAAGSRDGDDGGKDKDKDLGR